MEPPTGTAKMRAAVADRLARLDDRALATSEQRCPACCLSLRQCMCSSLTLLRTRHTPTVVIHAAEMGRSSSTHKLLTGSLPDSTVAVWGTEEWPSLSHVWDRVSAHCKSSGRVPAILFPADGALSPGELMLAATPQQRAAGLHLIVVDGTWSQARSIVRRPPAHATFCSVSPRQAHTLFGPARTQPGPGMLSTLEAVAVALDEAEAATRYYRGGIERSRWDPPRGWDAFPITGPECLLTTMHSEAAGIDGDDSSAALASERRRCLCGDATPLHPHGMPLLYPNAPRSVCSNALRLRLMRMVDAVCSQTGKIGPTRCGYGYRTWHVSVHPAAGPWKARPRGQCAGEGDSASDTRSAGGGVSSPLLGDAADTPANAAAAVAAAGDSSSSCDAADTPPPATHHDEYYGGSLFLATLPAFLITTIAEFAYGPLRVLPNGYFARHDLGNQAWAQMEGAGVRRDRRFYPRPAELTTVAMPSGAVVDTEIIARVKDDTDGSRSTGDGPISILEVALEKCGVASDANFSTVDGGSPLDVDAALGCGTTAGETAQPSPAHPLTTRAPFAYTRQRLLSRAAYPPYTSTPLSRCCVPLFFLSSGHFGPGAGWPKPRP